MNASVQIVNLGNEGPIKLVQAITNILSDDDERNTFREECAMLIKDRNATGLIEKCLSKRNAIFEHKNEETVLGCFLILFHLLNILSTKKENLIELTPQICQQILENGQNCEVKLKVVTNLYNMLPSKSSFQFKVLLMIVNFANENKIISMLQNLLLNFDAMIQNWEIETEEKRKIYLILSNAIEQNGNASLSQEYLMKYLDTFDSNDKNMTQPEVKEAAVKAAIGAIKSPINSLVNHQNILEIAPIQQLKKHENYADLFELVRIFNEDNFEAFLNFSKKNKNLFEKYEIEIKECSSKMRLLSLCTLASQKDSISYSSISSALKVELEEVEDWVVMATQAGLMEARMDQLEKSVLIFSSKCREFDKPQWISLQNKLNQWKENIRSLLITIKRTNEIQSNGNLSNRLH
mmetsp:Transcript_16390/g.23103  ORF Transcript_16390/g.23103 Transcript_16390/m.23103 type:complete len:407 (+) Transcript_16390:55-1275(+)